MEEDIEMGEDNIDMEEVLIYRKRPYRCVKRPETTDTKKNQWFSRIDTCACQIRRWQYRNGRTQ